MEKAKITKLHKSWVIFLSLLTDNNCKLLKYAGHTGSFKNFGKNIKRFPINGSRMQSNALKRIDQRILTQSETF